MVLTKSRFFDLLANRLAVFEVEDRTGKINWASHSLEQMFGYNREGELEGEYIEILVPSSDREVHANIHRPSYAANPEPRMMGRSTPDGHRINLQGQKKDGTLFPVEVLLIPCAADSIKLTVGVVLDMTGRT